MLRSMLKEYDLFGENYGYATTYPHEGPKHKSELESLIIKDLVTRQKMFVRNEIYKICLGSC